MLLVTCPSAVHSAGLRGEKWPAHFEYRRGMANQSRTLRGWQIINSLATAAAGSYRPSWCEVVGGDGLEPPTLCV